MAADHNFLFRTISFYCKSHITLITWGPLLSLSSLPQPSPLYCCTSNMPKRAHFPSCSPMPSSRSPSHGGLCHWISHVPMTHPQLVIPPARRSVDGIIPIQSGTRMDESTHNVNTLDSVQGTLFPEFMGQEPLQNVAILGDACDTKGVCTLFACMGNCVYVYQGDAITHALDYYNQGCRLPMPSRQLPNAAIHFDAGIMGPVRLFNTAGDICAIFSTKRRKKRLLYINRLPT